MAKSKTYEIDGHPVEFDAPSIETRFWVPEDAQTEEEWREAQGAAEALRTREDLFIEENMDGRNCLATHLLEALGTARFDVYLRYNHYRGEWEVCADWLGYGARRSYSDGVDLTPEGRAQLAEACKAEQARFMRRLRTYLKRYGMSKVWASTYWVNA